MKKNQVIKYGVVGALLLSLLGYGLYSATKVEPPKYMSATPSIRDIEQKVFATGTIAGKVSVDVGAQVSGQIKKLYVVKGDKVKAGDLLCEIAPEIQENNLRRAQAEQSVIAAQIRSKKAQITMLKDENTRQQNLLKRGATSKQSAQQAFAQYEMALADLEALNAQYEQAKISVDDATTNLGYTKIMAPMDGTVYAIPVEEGQTVNANQTTPTLVRLADLETMTVEAEISEADVVKIKPDMECRFTIMGLPNRYFKAKLRSIDPAPASAETSSSGASGGVGNSEAIYYNALLDVDNQEGILRIDMTAEVEITIASALQAKAIPIAAIKNESVDGSATVYQLINEQVVPKTIKVGVRDDQFIEVLNEDFDVTIPLVIGDDVATAASSASAMRRGPRMF